MKQVSTVLGNRVLVERLARLLIGWRWLLLGLAVTLTVVAWPASRRLGFDRSIENMFAPGDPLVAPYLQLKRTFGGDELALAAYVDPDLLTDAGIARLEDLARRLGEVPGVAATFTITSRLPLGPRLLSTPARERFLELCEGYTIGSDRQTVGIACLLEPADHSKTSQAVTIDRLRAIVDQHDASGVLTGEPVIVIDGFRHLERDGRMLGAVSGGLLLITIIFCFRSLRWVLIPAIVTYATLIWTRGLVVWLGLRMTMVSSTMWALVTVICVATVVHVIVAFRGTRAGGVAARPALMAAIVAVAAPVFWSCLTDAAGFGSLTISEVGPVHDFGIIMALASLMALLSMAMFIPGLALIGGFDTDPRRAWGEGRLDAALRSTAAWVERHPVPVGVLIAAITLPLVAGIGRMQVETDFTKNFREGSPVVRSYEFVESRLGGAGAVDVVIELPAGSDPDFLDRVRRLEDRLSNEVVLDNGQRGLTKTLSVLDVLDVVMPGVKFEPAQLAATLNLVRGAMPLVGGLYGQDPDTGRSYLRIMLRAHERQPAAQKQRLIEQVRRISHDAFPESHVTGLFVLLAGLIDSLLSDQWTMFAAASAGIGLMMLLAFRSPKLALIGLVPNALPILTLMGLLGWLGIRVNMGTAMIAAVSMGLSVDSSMHYVINFQRRRAAGDTVGQALHAVHQTVGRAMVFSTLALTMGFSALALSEFVPTIYFGVLVSLSMLGGLVGNLVVLPLLLTLTASSEPRPPASD